MGKFHGKHLYWSTCKKKTENTEKSIKDEWGHKKSVKIYVKSQRRRVREWNKSKIWWDNGQNFPDPIKDINPKIPEAQYTQKKILKKRKASSIGHIRYIIIKMWKNKDKTKL